MVVPRSSRRTVTVPRGRWMAASWSLTGARGAGERESEAAGCCCRGPARRLRAGVGPDQRHFRRRSDRTFVCDQGKCGVGVAGRALDHVGDRAGRDLGEPADRLTECQQHHTVRRRDGAAPHRPAGRPTRGQAGRRHRRRTHPGGQPGGRRRGLLGFGRRRRHRQVSVQPPGRRRRDPRLGQQAAHLGGRALDARPRAPLHHLGGPVREEADHPGRRRRPVPGQQDDVVHLPGAGLGRRSGQEDRRRSEEGEAHLGHPRVRRRACSPVRPGTRPGRAGTATRSPRRRPCGSTRAGSPAGPRDRGRAIRPGRPPRRSPPPSASRASRSPTSPRPTPRRATRGSPPSPRCRWSGSSSRC